MKFFSKWFYKQWINARREWESNPVCEKSSSNYQVGRGHHRSGSLQARGLTFTMYPASGGNVVEYHSYDETTDRNESKLHIIPTDSDMGNALAHIVTLEYLQR